MSHAWRPRAGSGALEFWPTPHTQLKFPRRPDTQTGPVTFHPHLELAQVNLQGSLDEPHILQSPTQGGSLPSPAPGYGEGRGLGMHRPHQTETQGREMLAQAWGAPRTAWPSLPPTPLLAHLGALLQAAAQLLQALSGGAARRAPGEGPLHVGGALPQAALDAVALIEFVHLPGRTGWWALPAPGPGPQICLSLTL